MRLAVASQCQDVEAIRRLFNREGQVDQEEDPPALSDEERETLAKVEASLRDRRERGELL